MGRGDTHGVLPVAEGGCPEMRQQDPERHLRRGGGGGNPLHPGSGNANTDFK